MLGIGADDIFVLSDAWKQSSLLFGRKNLEKRMEWTISKSSRSIFTTSFTTAVAFFGNLVSDIPPLKFFGLMTGCQVISDFVLTCTFLASALVIKSRYFDKEESDDGDDDAQGGTQLQPVQPVAPADGSPGSPGEQAKAAGGAATPGEPLALVPDAAPGAPADPNAVVVQGEWRPIENFFAEKYGPWMSAHAPKVMVVCALWLAIAYNVRRISVAVVLSLPPPPAV